MTSSTHGAAQAWRDESWSSPETDGTWATTYAEPLFDQELPDNTQPAYDDVDDGPAAGGSAATGAPVDRQPGTVYRTTGWTSHAAADGLPGRAVIAASSTAVAVCVGLDLALTSGRMTFFFDLCFVVICLVTAMSVRRSDLFTAGVLPPLLYAAVIAVLAVVAPQAFDAASGVANAFLTGLAGHAAGLVAGYGVALLTVAARLTAREGEQR